MSPNDPARPHSIWAALLDPSAEQRREPAERDLAYARWLLWAVAALYLIFGDTPDPLLGGVTVGLGVALNALFTWRVRRPGVSWLWSILIQVSNIVLGQTFFGACDLAIDLLYASLIITSAIRFGLPGALLTGLVGLGLAFGISQAGWHTLWVVLVEMALLSYVAYSMRRQYRWYRDQESKLQEQLVSARALYQVSRTVHDLKSEDALQNIVDIATGTMGFQRAALFLSANVEAIEKRQYSSLSRQAQELGLAHLFMSPDLFQAVLQADTPFIVDGSQGSPDEAQSATLMVAVPLHGDHAPIGVLVADRNDRAHVNPQEDKEYLSSLAHSAVTAIENASLHRRTRRMANHDGVTDLFNHRYFQEALRASLQEAADRWPVSLLMIEIDKFKRYNDTFGHRQGDLALISLARSLEVVVQPWQGVVARYGGDEFVAILPRISRDEGAAVARQIRDRACAMTEDMLRQHRLPSITLSVGVATYPDDTQTASDLIEASDQAMYVVKHSGGNQVHAFSAYARRTN